MSEIENLKIGNDGTLHIVGNEDIVANAWAAGKTYVKDKSYVIREHKLYVCNVTHTSTSSFDPTKWTEITVIGAIDNALDMTDTASGAIATFESEYALPLRNLEIEINAVQSGSGTPSPDNVRPITGFTGANIHVADNETPHIIDNVTAISWQSEAGTVYGGSLDVTSGVLVVTHSIVDLGTFDWTSEDSTVSGLARASSTQVSLLGAKYLQIPLCTHFKGVLPTSYSLFNNGEVGFSNSEQAPMIRARSTEFVGKTNAEIKALMSGVMLVYELATPVTYQLTPTQISAIVGTNNIFTDTNGDTSLEYYTKRGEQTVRIAEGVAVDVINNKNIDNLTTTNKTLVGAVNEVNSAYPTAINNNFKRAATVWGTSVTLPVDRNHFIVLASTDMFLIWFASTNTVRVRNVGANTTVDGTDSVTIGGITFSRSGLRLTVTASSSNAITILG